MHNQKSANYDALDDMSNWVMRLGGPLELRKVTALVSQDPKLVFTLTSYILTLITYVNLALLRSWVLGLGASALYFFINGIFLGRAFFEKEEVHFRLIFGVLLLITLLGFVGWLAVILYKLDITVFALVLFIATTLSSLLNKRAKNKNVS